MNSIPKPRDLVLTKQLVRESFAPPFPDHPPQKWGDQPAEQYDTDLAKKRWDAGIKQFVAAHEQVLRDIADAKRYRWLKQHAGMSTGHFVNVPVFGRREQTLEEAIDEAIKNEQS